MRKVGWLPDVQADHNYDVVRNLYGVRYAAHGQSGLIGKKRRRPGRRAPPCELRPTDLAATTASDGDEARNTQARDRRGSTRPRSSRDRSRRTALGQRLRRLEARQPPHSVPLRRRGTRAASPTNRIGVSWVRLPSLPHEFPPQVPRHSSCLVFRVLLNGGHSRPGNLYPGIPIWTDCRPIIAAYNPLTPGATRSAYESRDADAPLIKRNLK